MGKGYPSDWDSRRKRVYRRDNYTCQNCSAKGGPKGGAELQAHHIVPKNKGGTHQLSNLKTMCSDCHEAIHGNSKAPTAHGEVQTQGFVSQIKDIDANASFPKCPLCDSNRMGNKNVDAEIVGCANCGVELEKRGHGFQIVHMDDKLLNADLPINYNDSMKGYSLRASIWQKVGSEDDISQLDFDRLEEKSKEEEERKWKIVLIVTLAFLGISAYLITSVGLGLIFWLCYIVLLVVLMFFGRRIAQTNVDLTE